VSIASGTATFYDADDPSCTPKRFGQGEGIVEVPHHVHLTRNEGANPLVLFVASMTPTDKKTDIDEPRPGNCPF
jgi:mannose-6-phosphate isomerase-like protein (cupin superfamily)